MKTHTVKVFKNEGEFLVVDTVVKADYVTVMDEYYDFGVHYTDKQGADCYLSVAYYPIRNTCVTLVNLSDQENLSVEARQKLLMAIGVTD